MKHSEEWGWTRDTEVDRPKEEAAGFLWLLMIGVLLVSVGLFYTLPIECAKWLLRRLPLRSDRHAVS